ncbi:MAG: PepSY domain-containing protein, partial [Bacteroidota bacterium]
YTFATNLHRSLFLKSTGRFFVGIVSLLLCCIAITGIFLLIRRQGGVLMLFGKVHERNFEQRYHVILGRWMLFPIVVIAVTGVYLSAEKFSLLPEINIEHTWNSNTNLEMQSAVEPTDFRLFNSLYLNELKSVTFPFSESEEDYFQLYLKDRELLVHQYSGEVVSEAFYPVVRLASQISFSLHTGQGSVLWSFVLMIVGLSILFFIYSGFAMMLKRRGKGKMAPNVPGKDECEYIILVGSETGNTFLFAEKCYQALLNLGKKVFMTELNKYTIYENAKHMLFFTATYGKGEAPSNAKKFQELFQRFSQLQPVQFSVVGFGSLLYPDYCKFAVEVDSMLHLHPNFTPITPLHKINDQSYEEFAAWGRSWSSSTGIPIDLGDYDKGKVSKAKTPFTVSNRTEPDESNTFLLRLSSPEGIVFNSGDLLGYQPDAKSAPRSYSVAKIDGDILLSIKVHEFGIASQKLALLQKDDLLSCQIQPNPGFHFPENAPEVVMISNGTGIAPFLGMIHENVHRSKIHLFWGGRTSSASEIYKDYIMRGKLTKQLHRFVSAFSQGDGEREYIQDKIKKETDFIADVLKNKGVIMICGAIAMEEELRVILENISLSKLQTPLSHFESLGQIKTDCY